jgi:GT2 family glycosyltransferase
VREATSEIVAFTDDDIEVDQQWLSWLVEPFIADDQVAVVTGLVQTKTLDTPAQRWFDQAIGFGKGLAPRVYDTGPNRPTDRLLFPYWGPAFGTGGSMAFRRAALVAIGGFDPALGTGSPALGGSDVEVFTHLILRGGRLAYEPRALCWHNHPASETALERHTFTYAVGTTAIFTKWLLRDPRLPGYAAREFARLARGMLTRRGRATGRTVEGSRLANQLRMSRERGLLKRQLVGYALGPVFYLRSVLWVRRRHLHDVLPARGACPEDRSVHTAT